MSKKKYFERLFGSFTENIGEATAACLFTMVQGNVLLIGLSHWLIASQTGIIAGSLTAIALLITKTTKRWLVALVLGFATACIDFMVHPGMLGSVLTEAVVTGIGAGAISYIIGSSISLWRTRQAKKMDDY